VLFLIVMGIAAIVGYAYFGELSPNRIEVNQPVELDAN